MKSISIVNFDSFFGICRDYKINTTLQCRAFLQVATSGSKGFDLNNYNVEPEVRRSVYNSCRVLMGCTESFELDDVDRYRTGSDILIENYKGKYRLTKSGKEAWTEISDYVVQY